MQPQLYLWEPLRTKFKDQIRLFLETYTARIHPLFSNIEEEAKKIADNHYQELGTYFNPDCHDESDFAEAAWEKGLEYYDGISLMEYNSLLMWISTLYQFWEQQVRKFLYDEISHTHNIGEFKDFCSIRIIDEFKNIFSQFDQDITSFLSWANIDELRLLTNVIKHGDGRAATSLANIRPDIFSSEHLSTNLLDLYKTTLANRVLNVTKDDFVRYCESLIKFWDELPERMYLKK